LLQTCSLSRSRHLDFHHIQLGNTPLSASSPSPCLEGSGIGGSTLQRTYNLDAFFRWPAAPPSHYAVTAKGGL
jgi:hypothetical protein